MQLHPCQKSIADPEGGRLFQLGPWFLIYAI
jgi:hypothetical protein